jgi:hypothetical protein
MGDEVHERHDVVTDPQGVLHRAVERVPFRGKLLVPLGHLVVAVEDVAVVEHPEQWLELDVGIEGVQQRIEIALAERVVETTDDVGSAHRRSVARERKRTV